MAIILLLRTLQLFHLQTTRWKANFMIFALLVENISIITLFIDWLNSHFYWFLIIIFAFIILEISIHLYFIGL